MNTPALFAILVRGPFLADVYSGAILHNVCLLFIFHTNIEIVLFDKRSATVRYSDQITVFSGRLCWSNTGSLLLIFMFHKNVKLCFWQTLHRVSLILAADRFPTPLAFAQHSVTFAKNVVFRSGHNADFWQPFRHFSVPFGCPNPLLRDTGWPP